MAMSIALCVPVSATALLTVISRATRGDLPCLPVTAAFPRRLTIGTSTGGSPVIEI